MRTRTRSTLTILFVALAGLFVNVAAPSAASATTSSSEVTRDDLVRHLEEPKLVLDQLLERDRRGEDLAELVHLLDVYDAVLLATTKAPVSEVVDQHEQELRAVVTIPVHELPDADPRVRMMAPDFPPLPDNPPPGTVWGDRRYQTWHRNALVFDRTIEYFWSVFNDRNYKARYSFHNWGTDGCSNGFLPDHLNDTGLWFDFRAPCARHDFAYRNHKRMGHWSEDRRHAIDDVFLMDMALHCNTRNVVGRQTCQNRATMYYTLVRNFGS